eukprot:scaffold116703_cov63-Phaeocystis_antarctica.AAC.3
MRRQHAIGTGHAGLGHGHTPPTATTPMQATPRISRPPKTLRRIGFGLMLCSGDQSPGDCQDSGSWRLIFVRGVLDDGPAKSGSRPPAPSGAVSGARVASGVLGGSGSLLEDGSVKRRRGCARPSASSPSASTRENLGGTWIPDIAAGGVAWEEGAAPSRESKVGVGRERSSRKLEASLPVHLKRHPVLESAHHYAAIPFKKTAHFFRKRDTVTTSVTTLHDVVS